MSKLFLTPRRGSRSGSLLARALAIPKVTAKRLEGFHGSKDDIIINWGNSEPPGELLKCTLLNMPEAIRNAVNKKTALEIMHESGVSIPAFTDSENTAMSWVRQGHKVVARHILNGSSGEGIQILSSLDDFPCEAPLYTLYIPKKSEFRAHVIDGDVFDLQRKMRRKDVPDNQVNWQVRNHNNGFIFGRDMDADPVGASLYTAICMYAKSAVKSLGLDFGAVDLIYNDNRKTVYVLEVNTAPGLEGTTLQNYAAAFGTLFFKRSMKNRPRTKPIPNIDFQKFVVNYQVGNG